MSEMVERLAKVLREMGCGESFGCDEIARAMIQAMREPTEAMATAGCDADCADEHYIGRFAAIEAWKLMIDEALK